MRRNLKMMSASVIMLITVISCNVVSPAEAMVQVSANNSIVKMSEKINIDGMTADEVYEIGNKIYETIYNGGHPVYDESGEGEIKTVIEYFSKAALMGHARSAQLLGNIYINGDFRPADYCEAVKWCEVGIQLDNARSYTNMGILYMNGWGIEQNYEKALQLFMKAFGLEDMKAPRYIGIFYENGYGVDVNCEEAARFYQIAVENGDITSMYQLALLYENGLGVEQSYEKAAKLLEDAASNDKDVAAPAMVELGRLYENGLGVEKNLDRAIGYYKLAETYNNKDAISELKRLGI